MAFDSRTVENYIYMFLGIVVLFLVVAQLLPTAQASGDELNKTGAPLGGLFTSGGVVWLIVMVGIFILVVKQAMGHSKK